jgi:peptidoglycan-associated lipoprotein
MKTSIQRTAILLLGLAILSGCGNKATKPDDVGAAGGPVAGQDTGRSGMDTQGLGDGSVYGEGAAAGASAVGLQPGDRELLERTVIYFDFDSTRIRPEFSEVLAAHARYVSALPSRVVRLEGHTDERGSREYNIGLGERRAQAVRQVLMLQGVPATQITTVSYGEERPAVSGSDEEAWSLNRRVVIVYGN